MSDLSKIKDLLKSHQRGLNIREISEKLKINRNSVAKLLDILTAKEEVEFRIHGRSKIYYLTKPQDYRKWFELLSRTVEELNNFPPDEDIYAFIAGTLKHITPENTIIFINSFDQDTKTITVNAIEGLGQRQPDIEAILCRPLKGLAFSVPDRNLSEMLSGECDEIPGGLTDLTFGGLPYETCKKIEAMSFFGKVYSAGISWKGRLNGAVTFILPRGAELENQDLITFFIRQVAGFLSRKESEASLKTNEVKFRSLYSLIRLMCDNVPDMIWAKDLEKKYIFTNTAICRNLLNAADTDEPTGKNDLFFAERERTCHADDPEWHTFGEICRDTDQITLDAGTSQQFDEYGNVQGKFLFLDVRKAPFLDEQGKMIGTVGSARDVTLSKQLERELRESEAFNRGLVENLPDYIAVYGLDGNLLYVNPASAKILGYDEDTLVGTHVLSYVAEEYRDKVTANMETRFLKGGETSPYEIDMITKNGFRRSVIVKATPIQYKDNPAILLLLNDITERKRAEERLSEINKAFLTFSSDPLDNITILTGLAGKMLRGTCALYNRFEGGMLCSLGMWNTPPDFVPRDKAEGHICYDVIQNGGCSPTVIPDLMESPYAETDPNVKRYQLKTYVGLPVKIGKKQFGSLCVAYHDTYLPSPQDLEILSVLAKAIAIEDERRTTLEALQASESKFRNLMEFIPLGIQGYNTDGKVFFWNKASEKIYGYSREEALGKNLGTLIIPEDIKPFYHASLISATTLTKSGEFSPAGEVCLTRKDGTRVSVFSIHVAICGEKIPMLYCIDIDLTELERIKGEKRRSEEALRESEERLRSFIDQALEGISIIDEERRIIEWNPAQERITGISRTEAIGVNGWDLATRMIPDMHFWEEIRSRLEESVKSTIQSGTSTHPDPVYYQFHRPDGTIAIANQTVFLIKTSRGNMIGTLNQDVTEQQRADEKIRESEVSYRGLFNTVRQAIYIQDPEGKFIEVNDGAEAMYGYTRNEFIGRTPEFLSAPGKNDFPAMMEHVKQAFAGDPQQFEFWGLRRNGEIFPKDVRLYKGTYFGRNVVIAIGTDITERRRIEEEVRQKNLMLITINELEREFADLSMGTSVEELAAKKLSALSGAIVTIFLMYDPITRMLKPTVFKFAPGIRERLPSALEKVSLILGKSLEDIQIPVSEKMYHDMNRSVIGMKKTITELSYGKIRPLVSEGIQKLSGIDRFIHIAHIIDGELYGASVIGLRPDQPDTSQELLESFSHMVAVSLRRQQAEMALRESEASYRGLFNTVRQAIYILDHEGKFIDVNDGAEAMYGYARNEFIDRTPEFLSAPGKNNFAAVMEQIREAFVGEPQQFEFWGLRKNGEIFPKDVRLYKGTYFGRDVVIAIGTDITERKQRK